MKQTNDTIRFHREKTLNTDSIDLNKNNLFDILYRFVNDTQTNLFSLFFMSLIGFVLKQTRKCKNYYINAYLKTFDSYSTKDYI